ncbi:TRAP transporter small permease subunit [Neptunomonas sp.]|uniref:TRAP transporter small permease n=1 Tax=Neptunomonas sp. TaxID=1971898 RepID=UPI0025EC3535|nr:TRAP transporter small permease subunit [Neptunomonas sp.]
MEQMFRYILTALISTVAACQFIQVITRYVFETPIMGLEETALIPTIWLYIMGSVNASREDTQIRANVLEIFLKTDHARAILQAISEVISIAISIWLTWWAWLYFSYSIRVWKGTPTLYIPTFIYESALFIGLLMMTAFTIWHLIRNVQYLLGYRTKPDHEIDPDLPTTNEVEEFQILADTQKGNNNG